MKSLKSETLKRLDSHVDQVLKGLSRTRDMDLTNPELAKSFFIDTMWSIRNFEYIWFWMTGYVDLEKSSGLAFANVSQQPVRK